MAAKERSRLSLRRSIRALVALTLGLILTALMLAMIEGGLRLAAKDEAFQRTPKFVFSNELLKLKSETEKLVPAPWPHQVQISDKSIPPWQRQRTLVSMTPPFYQFDPDIGGLRPFPNSSSQVERKTKDGRLVYSVQYRFDQFGRRQIPVTPKKHRALFLGCSYTMGQGVEANEVFPAVFDRYQKNFTAEIFAFLAWSPTILLRALDTPLAPPASPPNNADVAIFTLFDHHLMRVTGSSDIASDNWLKSLNWFEKSDDHYRFQGQFHARRPLTYQLYRSINFAKNSSLLLNHFLPDLPVYQMAHLEFLADLVLQLKKTTAERLAIRNFQVLIFPGSFTGTYVGTMIRPLLEERGITVIDWSRIQLELYTPTPRLPFDGHPTKETHFLIGQALAATL